MAAGSGAVLTSFIINLVTAAICFAVFSYLRIQGWARRFFAPRSFAKDIELRPKPLADRFLAWVVPVLTYSEAHIIQECGLDAAMYLRVIRLGVYLFLPISLWTIIAVLPVNLTGGDIARILAEQATSNSTSAEQKYTDFDKYSLANVPKGSPRMWVHLVSVCAVVFYTLWVLHRFNHESVLLRLLFLANSKRGGPTHTVLVTDIPGIKEATAECAREHAAAEKEDKARRASEAKLLKAARSSSKTAAGKEQTDPELGAGGAPAVTDTASPSSGGSSGFEGPSTHATGTGFRSKSKFCMVDPGVDPRYAATGGRLDGPSMGPSRQEALQQLEAVSVDDVSLQLDHDPQALTTTQTTDNDNTESNNKDKDLNTAVVPALPTTASAVAGGALLDSPRHAAAAAAQRYPYDLTNKELDAQWQAKRALQDEGLTPQQLVAREFALVYSPRNVAAVNTVMDTSVLEPLVAEYDKIQQALEDYLDKAQLHMRLRKKMPHQQTTILVMLYGEWGAKRYGKKGFKKVDCLDHWTARLRFLKERILEEQRLALQKAAPSAFVTLNTRTAQSVGSASLHFHDETVWRVQGAPAPFEVVWPNLGMTVAEKSSRNTIMWVLFWLMTLFFMIPVAAIQALIEVPKLAAIPILGDIVTAPVVRQLLEAVVPGLVLKIFLALVPTILTIMIKASGATSLNELDFGVVSRFFLFQVVVVFFGSVVAGSFFNQLKVWAEDPGSIVPTLGKSIPMTSTFFITFVLVNGLGVKSIAFLRAPGLVIYWLLSKFAGSPRAKERLWTYQYTTSGTTVVDHTLTILLGITFSCMNPIMSLAALAYFLVNTLGEGYNNIYVFRRQYESAGRLWRTVYNQVMAALYLMQLTMLGVLALKRFPLTVLLIIPILISIGCHVSTLRLLNRPWSITALHDAAALDATEAKERRVALLQQAKQERKSALRARKAAAAASASPAAAAAIDDTKEPLLPQGPAESLLLEALGDNPFVMSDQEKAAIAENYKSPCFKVDLDVLEGLEAQAADTRGRLDLLNAWAERRDAAEKEWKKKQGKGSCLGGRGKGKGEEALPFQFPEAPPPEVTIYDVGGEGVAMEEGAKGAGAGAAVEEGEQQAKAKD